MEPKVHAIDKGHQRGLHFKRVTNKGPWTQLVYGVTNEGQDSFA